MLQRVIDLLPGAITQMPPALAATIAVVGLLLALAGARFSRPILTLLLVAVGALVGLRLPRWFGWKIDPMGPAFGVAILLGLAGFSLTLLVEVLLLGCLLAAIAGTVTWLALAVGVTWQPPDIDWSLPLTDTVKTLYASLPPSVANPFLIALGVGAGAGWLAGSLYPRLGRILLMSLGGLIVFSLAGSIAATRWHPAWLDVIGPDPRVRWGIMAALLALCMLVQAILLRAPRRRALPPAPAEQILPPLVAPGTTILAPGTTILAPASAMPPAPGEIIGQASKPIAGPTTRVERKPRI